MLTRFSPRARQAWARGQTAILWPARSLARSPSRNLSQARSDESTLTLHNDSLSQVSRLSNGLRVATEALPGSFSAVGIYIDAGSRYETADLRGASHLMDRLAFKATTKSDGNSVLQRIEVLGGNIQCSSSREIMMYQAATFNKSIEEALEILADTIRYPLITDEELQAQLRTAEYEICEIWSKPELILPEVIHAAAFHENTLGNPLLCPRDRLTCITTETIERYRRLFYTPDRIVIAFVGLPHQSAVALTEKYFGDMQPVTVGRAADSLVTSSTIPLSYSASTPCLPPTSSSPLGPLSRFLRNAILPRSTTLAASSATNLSSHATPATLSPEVAHYTGGFFSLPPQPPSLNPNLSTYSHIHIAFEGLSLDCDDLYALATLQSLLGGGGSFSAGGPGKGMFSRLYSQVLNQHAWVESCVAFNHSYADSGLFGISASCQPSQVMSMLQVMCDQLHALTAASGHRALSRAEVSRAKNLLRSNLLMNLESRMIVLEDLGRQIHVHGSRISVSHMLDRIDALTPEDLARVATKVLRGEVHNRGAGSGAPTVVMQESSASNTTTAPTWSEMQQAIYSWGLGRNSLRK